jgi:transcriptional/translational regulatory protein YebC/TACO1
MAARKQFINRPTPNEKLKELLEDAKKREVSDEVLAAQRISFAFGNASDAENITKASITAAANRIRLMA